ncbi:MAG: hypothetical protein FJZ04_00365 [Candidatus Moranbacteria bacterium]|nr:hypothetical protein [Candidatus Moranbacteria bacterium]
MSDALTDIARDEQRGRLWSKYLYAIEVFLEEPTNNNRRRVAELARETDSVRGGYMSGITNLQENLEETLNGLMKGNKEVWVKFLSTMRNAPDLFKRFKSISPFPDKLFILVDYGCGFVNFYGELEEFVRSLIENSKGWQTYDGDKYALVLDMPAIESPGIYWLSHFGATGPRPKR